MQLLKAKRQKTVYRANAKGTASRKLKKAAQYSSH